MSNLASETQTTCQTWDPVTPNLCDAWNPPATLATATYNFAGRMTGLSDYSDSQGTASLQWTESRTYNSLMQLTNITNTMTGGTQLVNMTYNFSATQNNGRIVSSSDAVTGENVSYTYDALNRLIAAATTNWGGPVWGNSYSYDGFGNLTGKTVTRGTNRDSLICAIFNRTARGRAE
jgi:YD repeat-containing protein